MKHDSNDIKQTSAQLLSLLPVITDDPLNTACLELILPSLVMGTREKNTIVRANSELAIIEVLRLRQKDDKVVKVGGICLFCSPNPSQSINLNHIGRN